MPKKKTALTIEERLQQALVPAEEQTYEVPENWVWVRLIGNVNLCLDGYRKPINSNERAKRVGNVPYYGATGQVGWIDDYLTNEHLVLLGEDGAPFLDLLKDKAYVIFGKAWVNNHAHILKSCFGEIGNVFLMHYLNTVDYKDFVKGTTRLKLTQGSMQLMPFPLPPLSEQQRIVERIEELFAKLDEAKERLQEVADSFAVRKAAILHKAFTGELTKQWRRENGVSDESWEEKKLGEICKIGSGGTPSRKHAEYYNGNIPWIKTGELAWNVITEAEEYITEEAVLNSSAKMHCAGSVLVAMYGQGLTRGKAAILGINATTNQAVCALKPLELLMSEFLFYYFMKNYWQFREEAVGGNQPNYSAKMISSWSISLPTLPEQHEIVRLINDLLARERSAQQATEQALASIDLMKKSILARAFRGELGTNKASEASALELLRQVLAEN